MNTTQKTANELADGIYIVCMNDEVVKYTGPETATKNDAIGIGVKLGSKSLIVGLTDAANTATQCCTLTTEDGGTRFFKSHADAVADWDGKAGTDDLRKILNPSIKMDAGQYIPSLGQMYFILCHLKAINEALEFVGGQPLDIDSWYWSSTSYSANTAWILYLHLGRAYDTTKAPNQRRVRPVSAFI